MTSPSFACIRTRGAQAWLQEDKGEEKKKGEDISGGFFNRFFFSLSLSPRHMPLCKNSCIYIDIK